MAPLATYLTVGEGALAANSIAFIASRFVGLLVHRL
jgi:hypothetical protein